MFDTQLDRGRDYYFLPHRVRKESHVWVRKMTQILEEELDIDGYWDFVERLEKDPDGLLRDLRRHDTDQVLIDNDTLKMLKEASSDRMLVFASACLLFTIFT